MFKNTPHGFHMGFPNGWLISVQWGPGNYCEARSNPADEPLPHQNPYDGKFHEFTSDTAEIAVMHEGKARMYPLSDSDDVKGWIPSTEVSEYIQWVSQLDADYDKVMAEAPYKGLNLDDYADVVHFSDE